MCQIVTLILSTVNKNKKFHKIKHILLLYFVQFQLLQICANILSYSDISVPSFMIRLIVIFRIVFHKIAFITQVYR